MTRHRQRSLRLRAMPRLGGPRTFTVTSHAGLAWALERARTGDRVLIGGWFVLKDRRMPFPHGRHHRGTVLLTSRADIHLADMPPHQRQTQWVVNYVQFGEWYGDITMAPWSPDRRGFRMMPNIRNTDNLPRTYKGRTIPLERPEFGRRARALLRPSVRVHIAWTPDDAEGVLSRGFRLHDHP